MILQTFKRKPGAACGVAARGEELEDPEDWAASEWGDAQSLGFVKNRKRQGRSTGRARKGGELYLKCVLVHWYLNRHLEFNGCLCLIFFVCVVAVYVVARPPPYICSYICGSSSQAWDFYGFCKKTHSRKPALPALALFWVHKKCCQSFHGSSNLGLLVGLIPFQSFFVSFRLSRSGFLCPSDFGICSFHKISIHLSIWAALYSFGLVGFGLLVWFGRVTHSGSPFLERTEVWVRQQENRPDAAAVQKVLERLTADFHDFFCKFKKNKWPTNQRKDQPRRTIARCFLFFYSFQN